MLISKACRYPDHRPSFQRRCIGQNLSEVAVISFFQLVLDQYMRTAQRILADYIRSIRADRYLKADKLQIETKFLTQYRQIARLCKPRREMLGFVLPYLAKFNTLKLS